MTQEKRIVIEVDDGDITVIDCPKGCSIDIRNTDTDERIIWNNKGLDKVTTLSGDDANGIL